MKATELISRLAKLIEEHGDGVIHLSVDDCTFGGLAMADAKSAYLEQEIKGRIPVFEIYGE